MRLGIWDTLFNVALFIVWFRFWKKQGRTVFFNTYVGAIERTGQGSIDLVRSTFRSLSDKGAAFAVFVFGLLFRAVIFRSLSGSDLAAWDLGFGIVPTETPPIAIRLGLALSGGWGRFVALSVISFGTFLFYLWGIALIYARTRQGSSMGHTEEAVFEFSKPLTFFKAEFRPLLLLIFGMALTSALIIAVPFRGIALGSPLVAPFKAMLSAMLAWVQGLQIMLKLVMGLIIGSWIAMFSGSFGLAGFCRDWLNLFLGPMRRFPIRIGMLDLSPLVFFFLVHFIAATLDEILRWSYWVLP